MSVLIYDEISFYNILDQCSYKKLSNKTKKHFIYVIFLGSVIFKNKNTFINSVLFKYKTFF